MAPLLIGKFDRLGTISGATSAADGTYNISNLSISSSEQKEIIDTRNNCSVMIIQIQCVANVETVLGNTCM